MRYVVGYTANSRGHDAVNLAVALAHGPGASLDLVLVVPEVPQFGAAHAPRAGFENFLDEQAGQWLKEAMALVPEGITARAHVRTNDSEAQALIEASREFDADLLVIGATSTGLFKRFTIGSVAGALLHAATVPVALAPHGYYRTEPLGRLSCGLGNRPGAEAVLRLAAAMAAERQVPLRLVSLLALDGEDPQHAESAARASAEQSAAAGGPGVGKPEIIVAQGRTIEEAVDRLDWRADEVLLIGSSRLAQHRSIFLGTTANRILRALPVPMIVVPRDYERSDAPPTPVHSTSNDFSREAHK